MTEQHITKAYLIDVYNRLMASIRHIAKRHPAIEDVAAEVYSLWLGRPSKLRDPKAAANFLRRDAISMAVGYKREGRRGRQAGCGAIVLDDEIVVSVPAFDVEEKDDSAPVRRPGGRPRKFEAPAQRALRDPKAPPHLRALGLLQLRGWTLAQIGAATRRHGSTVAGWRNGLQPPPAVVKRLVNLARSERWGPPKIKTLEHKKKQTSRRRLSSSRRPSKAKLTAAWNDLVARGWTVNAITKALNASSRTIVAIAQGEKNHLRVALAVVRLADAGGYPPTIRGRALQVTRPEQVCNSLAGLGWSDRQLAARLGACRSTLRRWRAGDRCAPDRLVAARALLETGERPPRCNQHKRNKAAR